MRRTDFESPIQLIALLMTLALNGCAERGHSVVVRAKPSSESDTGVSCPANWRALDAEDAQSVEVPLSFSVLPVQWEAGAGIASLVETANGGVGIRRITLEDGTEALLVVPTGGLEMDDIAIVLDPARALDSR